ncbi:hypothetical protein EG68_11456 [Paragonimus skrjabini miyazakii]|uniref:Uncharacterized protein n=1 Tax=Paragonimus skrjabini miyazakii TaxID=59628 RepID=A0A8S9YDD2_9TREM|nr:hypothetical protein EG68_11456 [Paragonimus skrjabini miyazakii]
MSLREGRNAEGAVMRTEHKPSYANQICPLIRE